MKEKYLKPRMETEEFKAVDVLTTSSFDDRQGDDNDVKFGE